MTTDGIAFNAAWDPWLPLERDGETTLASISEAVRDAHNFGGLSLTDPLAAAALTRLLVAVVMRTHDLHSPTDVERLWSTGRFTEDRIEGYLNAQAERFEVFHPETPFLQVAELTPASGSPKGAAALLLHVPSGNNVPLFSALSDGDLTTLDVPTALVNLVTVQGFDTAAIKPGAVGDPAVSGGKTTGNPTGSLGQLGLVQLIGRNLFETILLNAPIVPALSSDSPVWERRLAPAWETRLANGTLDLLTWPSRRIRLIPNEAGTTVDSAVVTAGDRLAVIDPSLEPHTRWRATKNDVVAHRPMRWQPGSNAWRGLDALLALNTDQDVSASGSMSATVIRQLPRLAPVLGECYPLRLLCVGVSYGNQSAVIEDVYVDTMPLPLAALRAHSDVHEALLHVSSTAEQLRRALNALADDIRRVEGGDKLPWDAGIHPGNDAMSQLTTPTMRLLRGLQSQPNLVERGVIAWEQEASRVVWATATRLLDAASPQAFGGRDLRVGSGTKRIRLADCEAWFREAVGKALPNLPSNRNDERWKP